MGARSSEFQLLSTVLSVVAPASPQRVLEDFLLFNVWIIFNQDIITSELLRNDEQLYELSYKEILQISVRLFRPTHHEDQLEPGSGV